MTTLPPRDYIALDTLLSAYVQGAFPMADSRTGRVDWFEADPRAILPITPNDPAGAFHCPRSLAKLARQQPFEIRQDTAFRDVMIGCAEPRTRWGGEEDTWINPSIINVFCEAHASGLAHSVEAWQDGQLVGGIYGLCLSGAFFAESMFSRVPNASKICLLHLVQHLQSRGHSLLDVQMHNPHLDQFGVVEIRRDEYKQRLAKALAQPSRW